MIKLKLILVAIWGYIARVFSACSQLLNALIGGEPNESICGRCYRQSWLVPMRVLDVLFAPVSKGRHCRGAYNQDRLWAQKAALWPERVPASEE